LGPALAFVVTIAVNLAASRAVWGLGSPGYSESWFYAWFAVSGGLVVASLLCALALKLRCGRTTTGMAIGAGAVSAAVVEFAAYVRWLASWLS
jgi:hypothetical protein